MEKKEVIDLVNALSESLSVIYLTSIDENSYPQTRAMFNLRNPKTNEGYPTSFEGDEALTFYFTTNTSSQKIPQIKNSKKASVYLCKPDCFDGILLKGDIEIIEDTKIKQALWRDGWKMYYPQGNPNDPDYSILRFVPHKIQGWSRGQKFEVDL
ncbi:MAG TPA: pyridoxamine 5'-phosphate oxidase family protein [Caldisericia bacterium]|nr:pyridoxamine 5'-phosphate oxidase family protein [Caldisericia bacterium]HPF49003.1 pyridoxamine 5'-phosphate oxidase family protein [Caldisericia bacterium]HPI83133.1 pyridoxamine 5'-phosphate oxidase family protein [Caldisericia bacterium]HPQ92360.1 pyridoxamine 5'-phosphate oxidase family protein [Caldisericia bacterium]HRV74542.1 pyridoxamine 5'-phosphate oxidase family protein [Caldisericia bacterium]